MARFDRPRRLADPGQVTAAERGLILKAVSELKGLGAGAFSHAGELPWDRIEARLGKALGLDGRPPFGFYAQLGLLGMRGAIDSADPEALVASLVEALAEERRYKAGIRV